MVNSIALILAVLIFIFLGGLFSGAETGIYQLSRLRLRLGIEKRRWSFVILGRAMRDSPGLLLSMLIGTNLACYLMTSIVTYLLLSKVQVEHTAGLFATFITAPALFIFSELIPKNIFFYRADSLMPYCAPVLFIFHKLATWTGVVPALKFISGIFWRLTSSQPLSKTAITAVRPRPVRAIFQDTQEEGILSPVQADIMNRLVSISSTLIRTVMTPIAKVQMLDVNCDNSVLLNKLRNYAFTRLPVYDHSPGNIVGFINIYEAVGSGEQFTDVRNFVKPIRKLPSDTTVTEAINIMQNENQKIAMVTRIGHAGQETPIGIVTMKDLVEELLGELSEW